MLGPWVHGYFKLPSGVVIKDTDAYQRARLFHLRGVFIEVLEKHYGKSKLQDKTILDIGCNAGYFLYELFKHFEFKKARGLDPKKSNIDKARFIASQFMLSKSIYSVSLGDVFKIKKNIYDVVIMPGVLHHLDDHILACKRLFEITGDILVLETMALPDTVESSDLENFLELKDDVYKGELKIFGVTGHKLESSCLDGGTASSGIVSIPSKNSVYLSLFNAGFRDIKLFTVEIPFAELDECLPPKYRDMHIVVAVAIKPKLTLESFFNDRTRLSQHNEIDILVPLNIVEPLFKMISGERNALDVTGEANLIYMKILKNIKDHQTKSLQNKPYYEILCSLMHAPLDKIRLDMQNLFMEMATVQER